MPILQKRAFIPYNKDFGMNLLLTNDDGINGEGLTVLALALIKAGHSVTVVAPDCNNSAVSHKINMHSPLRLSDHSKQFGYPAYALNGTPADCVMFALGALKIEPRKRLHVLGHGRRRAGGRTKRYSVDCDFRKLPLRPRLIRKGSPYRNREPRRMGHARQRNKGRFEREYPRQGNYSGNTLLQNSKT